MGTEYFIIAGTEPTGPFSLDRLAKESITAETLVYSQGMNGWTRAGSLPELQQLLSRLPPPIPKPVAAVPVAVAVLVNEPSSVPVHEPPPVPPEVVRAAAWEQIKQIALWQRYLILGLVGFIVLYALFALIGVSQFVDVTIQVLSIPLWFWMLFRLLRSLGLDPLRAGVFVGAGIPLVSLIGLLMFDALTASFVNLIPLLLINHLATQRLRAAGLRVGFWGARDVPEQPPESFHTTQTQPK